MLVSPLIILHLDTKASLYPTVRPPLYMSVTLPASFASAGVYLTRGRPRVLVKYCRDLLKGLGIGKIKKNIFLAPLKKLNAINLSVVIRSNV